MGQAEEIRLVAEATANGIAAIANVIANSPGGHEAMNLRLAEQYISEFGRLAKEGNTFVVPANLADVAGFIKLASAAIKENK